MAALSFMAACAFPFFGGAPEPIAETPDFGEISFSSSTPVGSPSPLPTLTPTITPTPTAFRTPYPSPSPTFSPYRWTCADDGSSDPCRRALRDVSLSSVSDGWAVGERGVILHWDGQVFSRAESPADLTLRLVAAVAADDAWAVGDEPRWSDTEGFIWASKLLHWNGSAWSIYPAKESLGRILDVSFTSKTNGWAIAASGPSENPVHYFLRWNGSDWNRHSVAPPMLAIQMLSAANGWAVGKRGVIMRWDGRTWEPADSPTERDLEDVAFHSEYEGWAISRQGTIVRYAAGEWLEYSTLAPDPRKIVLDADGGGWILGAWQFGDVMLRWNGKDWVKYQGDFPDGEVLSIAAPAPNEFLAVGWTVGRGRTGMAWQWGYYGWQRAMDVETFPVRAADFVSAKAAWAVGEDGFIGFWNGAGWEFSDSPTSQTLHAVRMLSAAEGWAAGEGGQILRWNGAAWSVEREYQWRALVKRGEYPRIESLAFLSPVDGWAAGRMEGANMLSPLLLHWDGATWKDVDLGEQEDFCKCGISALQFNAPDDGWALGGGEAALILHWDGLRWEVGRGPDGYRLLGAGGLAADDMWAAGVNEWNTSVPFPGLAMHWNGSNWRAVSLPPDTGEMRAVLMVSPEEGWMAGKDVLHWTGAGWNWMPSPVDSIIVSLARTADGSLWAVTDNGVVLKLERSG